MLLACDADDAAARESTIEQKLAQRVDIVWRDVTLRDAIDRLSSTTKIDVWLDRGVDPTRSITLRIENTSSESAFARLAEAVDATAGLADEIVYVGPADRLSRLQRAHDLRDASRSLQRTLKRRAALRWSRLDTPAEVLKRFAAEHRIVVEGLERVPHDLLPAGTLPKRAVADQLSLLLVGFDLDWRVSDAGSKAIDIVPLRAVGAPVVFATDGPAATPTPASDDETRYTLRIREQPLLVVLRQVSQRVGRELVVASSARELVEQRVSFRVAEATLEELLEAAAASAGLEAIVEDDRILIETP